jgi:hypothetical protein
MAKVLIDNDEEGDDVPRLQYARCTCRVVTGGTRDPRPTCPVHSLDGPDRLALAIDELSAVVDQAEEVKRLRAINQELVAACEAVLAFLGTIEWNDDWSERDAVNLQRTIDLALQHAETRTP